MAFIVTNKTNQILEILGCTIKPGETRSFFEIVFDRINIKSGIGNCEVVTKGGRRNFVSYGLLRIVEGSVDYWNSGKKLLIYEAVA